VRGAALVTGSRRGIGFGIARRLAAEGFDLIVNGTGGAPEIRERISELERLGARVLYCRADVSVGSDRARMLEEAYAAFGRISVLVNNAGVAPSVRADILEATEESYDRVMGINLKGPYFLTQAVARRMVDARKQGSTEPFRIVNVSSVSARVASTNRGEYCVSKAGVSMATKLWAVRLAEYDIGVYEVQPGIIRTDMTAGVTAKYDSLIAGGLIPQKRWGLPEDVGSAVAMIARGDLGFSTGQVILVDGGQLLERL
jgi:NAD(P)-dependent dehydrogenase (short-subunit alcohol dehydrogenase family)